MKTMHDINGGGNDDGDDNNSTSSDALEEGSQVTSKESLTHGTAENESTEAEIGRHETKAVLRLRIMVILALFAAAATVCVVVFVITNRAEQSQFNAEVDSSASKVIESFEGIVGLKIDSIVSLAVAATAYARSQNESWPFVTLNDFQQRAVTARGISDSLSLEILPVVTAANRKKWEVYSVANRGWLAEGMAYQNSLGLGFRNLATDDFVNNTDVDFSSGISNKIYSLDKNWQPVYDPGPGPYYPLWQQSPVRAQDSVNYNLGGYYFTAPYIHKCAETGDVVFGGIDVAGPGDSNSPNVQTSFFAFIQSFAAGHSVQYNGDPMSSVYIPIFDNYDKPRNTVAVLIAVLNWATYFDNALPQNSKGVDVVLENTCQGPFTYRVDGQGAYYRGKGDLHNSNYNDMLRQVPLDIVDDSSHLGLKLNQDICKYFIQVYPSQALYDQYHTSTPLLVTLAVASMFLFAVAMFFVYDRLVERRQKLVLSSAQKTSAIVSSLFPENVRDRIIGNAAFSEGGTGPDARSGNQRLKSFLSAGTHVDDDGIKPIADLFPHTTVIFSDISGFTAWSSTRDPAQVFILLQTVYRAFDAIANQRKVFKVETIGDSYIAVTGLPNPQEKHAVIAARFAWDCLIKFNELVSQLEAKLGPDTADLKIRFGLHSGPCTAGVLRGERSRFQLFGDTVNTAARMESTGVPNMIQASSTSAALLVEAKKQNWIQRRSDSVEAKGKGLMDTYWVVLGAKPSKSTTSSNQRCEEPHLTKNEDNFGSGSNLLKQNRLVDWITDLLLMHITKIVAKRNALNTRRDPASSLVYFPANGKTCLDEVEEVITMPQFDSKTAHLLTDGRNVELSSTVVSQLREVVAIVASTYRTNPFHNFEHACHVTMSVDKLLMRVVTPDLDDEMSHQEMASRIHDYTHGINSDPLTWLAIIFAALIHDVDHRGISNAQLIKEEEQMANLYKNKSVAEQNSLDVAWQVLMGDQFEELRACIFSNRDEMLRFRQLIVNVVLATDIFDKELNDLRKARWNKAFAGQGEQDNNLRATIVIEHMIQASDVAHTMQHWHIYRKWNERLFAEMYASFNSGRMGVDPSTFWYKGEIGFFDNYILPLAKKLKECNVFGVSSDEYLNYAKQNREEWAHKGEQIVAEMVEKYAKKNGGAGSSGDANQIDDTCIHV